MAKPLKFVGIENLSPEVIQVESRARAISGEKVAMIRTTAEAGGGIYAPIHVRKVKLKLILIDGLHRLAAAKEMGVATITCMVWEGSAEAATFMEADANLSSLGLKPLDMALSLAAWKRIYVKDHPETAAGVAGAMARHMQGTKLSFADHVADAMGVHRKKITRAVRAGEALTSDHVRWLREAPKAPTMDDLTALAKEADESVRAKAIIDFTNGAAKGLKAALKAHSNTPPAPVVSPDEVAHRKLLDAFDRASKAARKRFVSSRAAELRALLGEVQE